MHFTTLLSGLGLLAGLASAAPHAITERASSGQVVVYWGQNGGGTVENNDLSAYCAADSGIDVLVLAFLYEFGNGNNIPSGTIGQSCFISTSGEGQNCDALSSAITKCQSAGVKIILSLGGASGAYSLQSASDAEAIGQYLWDAYANSGNTTVQRPLGDAFVNGFDFDIELNNGNQYYKNMISTLRGNFASDSGNTYYITGAPQCPIPEPNMGEIIGNSTFDYLFVQFYNNNNYTFPCALPFNGNAPFNYDDWVQFTMGGPSANAEIFIGVPASTLGANGSPSGATYYITPDQLASLVDEYESHPRFGGVMMWNAGFSDENVIDGCTYAQQANSILSTGATCDGSTGGSPPVGGGPTTTAGSPPATSSASAPGSSPTGAGTVPQWGQCGGQDYAGPTQCVAPFKCVEIGAFWSQCE